jgi:hypothetical protein
MTSKYICVCVCACVCVCVCIHMYPYHAYDVNQRCQVCFLCVTVRVVMLCMWGVGHSCAFRPHAYILYTFGLICTRWVQPAIMTCTADIYIYIYIYIYDNIYCARRCKRIIIWNKLVQNLNKWLGTCMRVATFRFYMHAFGSIHMLACCA